VEWKKNRNIMRRKMQETLKENATIKRKYKSGKNKRGKNQINKSAIIFNTIRL
jgi:hypothetical protein